MPPVLRIAFDGNTHPRSERGTTRQDLEGKIEFVAGVRGQAARFDKHAAFKLAFDAPIVERGFTIALWLRIESFPAKTATVIRSEVLDVGSRGPGIVHAYWRMPPEFAHSSIFHLMDGKLGQAERGRWYHILIARDIYAREIRHYVDGTLTKSAGDFQLPNEVGTPYAETMLSLAFGGWAVTLDELELYDYPFTKDQVSAAFQASQPTS